MRADDCPVELVIFDCDGVLVDSEPLANEVLAAHLARAGVALTGAECRARFQGRSLASVGALVERDFEVTLDDRFFERLQRETYVRFREALEPVRGMRELLGALRAPWCIASSGGHDKMAVTLAVTGLDVLVGNRVFSAVDVARGKPAPDLFLYAARRMGIAPQRCLVIEDSVVGIEAALAAAMQVIGFAGASGASASALASTGVDVATDAGELAHRVAARGLVAGAGDVGCAVE